MSPGSVRFDVRVLRRDVQMRATKFFVLIIIRLVAALGIGAGVIMWAYLFLDFMIGINLWTWATTTWHGFLTLLAGSVVGYAFAIWQREFHELTKESTRSP